MTFLVLEALWELGSFNPPSAHGQTKTYDETKPPEEPKRPDETKPPERKKPSSATKIIPSVVLTERYDSNVLFVPSGFSVGRPKWDFVTTVAPTVQVLNNGRYVDTAINAAVSGNLFINNPDLNFASTGLTGSATLDKFVNQFIRGAKLQVSDSFTYTPESPSFVNPTTPGPTDNPFARGLVPVRANMYTNTALVAAAYPISPGLDLQGSYSYSLLRVGEILVKQPVDAPVLFFNSDYHTWSIGPNWRFSRSDSVSVTYKSSIINSSDTSGQGVNLDFVTRGAEASYTTTAADWGASLSAGATVFDGDRRIYATGMLSLTTKYGDSTNVRFIGSRQIAPAFFATGGALISTTGGVSVEHRFSRHVSLTGTANYAHNEVAPVNFATFDSYAASALLAYNVTRSVTTSLGYSYTYFAVDSPVSSEGLAGYIVNRHFVTFSITAKWN